MWPDPQKTACNAFLMSYGTAVIIIYGYHHWSYKRIKFYSKTW